MQDRVPLLLSFAGCANDDSRRVEKAESGTCHPIATTVPPCVIPWAAEIELLRAGSTDVRPSPRSDFAGARRISDDRLRALAPAVTEHCLLAFEPIILDVLDSINQVCHNTTFRR